MAAINRLYLDTNIFIALGEGTDAISALLFDLIARQMPEERFLFTSELSLAELLVHPYRERNEELISLYDNWITSGGWLTAGPVNRSVLLSAALIRAQYGSIKLPDAIHLSTAIGFECTHFLTADKRLPSEIRIRHERWGSSQGPAEISVLKLEPDVLRHLINERSKT